MRIPEQLAFIYAQECLRQDSMLNKSTEDIFETIAYHYTDALRYFNKKEDVINNLSIPEIDD